MNFRIYVSALWRRKWIILLTTIAAVAAAIVFTSRLKPEYQAYAIVRIQTATSGDANWVSPELLYSDRLMNSYIVLAQIGPMQRQLMRTLQVDELPETTVNVLPNTELVQITTTSGDPKLAADAANGVAEIMFKRAWETYPEDVAAANTNLAEIYLAAARVNIVENALIPEEPSGPNRLIYYVLGVVVGVAGGLGLALLFEALEPRLLTTIMIQEVANLPVLGRISHHRRRPLTLHAMVDESSSQGESFRRLTATYIMQKALQNGNSKVLATRSGAKTVLITSPQPDDGKTTVAANLAWDSALNGYRTVIVDSNLRHPKLHTVFGLRNELGLQDLLDCQAQLRDVVVKSAVCYGLSIITTGSRSVSTSQIIDPFRLHDIFKELKSEYDLVFIDGSSIFGTANAIMLASQVDDVLIVVQRQKTRRDTLEKTLDALSQAKAHVTGLVITNAEKSEEDRQYNHYRRRRE